MTAPVRIADQTAATVAAGLRANALANAKAAAIAADPHAARNGRLGAVNDQPEASNANVATFAARRVIVIALPAGTVPFAETVPRVSTAHGRRVMANAPSEDSNANAANSAAHRATVNDRCPATVRAHRVMAHARRMTGSARGANSARLRAAATAVARRSSAKKKR